MKGTVLERIVASTQARIERERAAVSADQLAATAFAREPLGFEHALRQRGPSIIAEVKLASPSEGPIAPDADPVAVAQAYAANGAAAISVLTEPEFFRGSLDYLRNIRAALPQMPLLMKDFVVDEYQLLQGRAAGADAALLIVAALGKKRLKTLAFAADELGLETLVEVHTADELKIALDLGVSLIGVNNRDLKTLAVSLDVARELAARMQDSGATLVAESGIRTAADIADLASHGYHAFLIGTHLIRSGRPGEALAELLGRTPA